MKVSPSRKTVLAVLGFGLIALFLFLAQRNVGPFLQPASLRVYRPPDRGKLRVKSPTAGYSLVLITVDALRPDYLGANGYDRDISPAMDGLIREGFSFSNCSTPIPSTTQSLACLLSGCYPYKTGVRVLWDSLSPGITTLAEILKEAGFQTVAVTSNYILSTARGLNRGFDVYDRGLNTRDALQTTEAALGHLKRLSPERPFFLWLHYIDPHVPYYPPADLAAKIDPGYEGKYKLHFGDVQGGVGEGAFPADMGKERAIHHNDLDDGVNRHIRRLYAADIQLADLGIGRLLAGLNNLVQDRFIIILTADHGESLGEHDYYFNHGEYLYEAGLRVPLAFFLPRAHPFRAVGRVDDQVSLIDVLPTALDLAGVEVLSDHLRDIDGLSLAPYWRGGGLPPRPLFAESDDPLFERSIRRRVRFDLAGRFRCVVFDRWKLIWTPGQKPDSSYELYDLREDPVEVVNLYSPAHPKFGLLAGFLQGWMKRQKIPPPRSKPRQEDLEILRSLGYIR